MEPVFIDFHIHTSDNPESLNESYDLDMLKVKIGEIADGAEYLISLTDHNTVNKPVYLKAVNIFKHILLGVELHVRNYKDAKPYHCHILFNLEEINALTIDNINQKLDELYPNKEVSHDDDGIPTLEKIMNLFDEHEFVLLPHGGQSHSTFDGSIPDGVQFDKTLERSIYYNHFDGFTARSNKGLERTQKYFGRLGIKEFVNLVTATDNYVPRDYPHCKAGRGSSDFIPTWMLASPTFNGLRLSLSESSRLIYGEKPDSWAECIQHVFLRNENIDIDVDLAPGLNVVIGGSSSGKSLFVDSVYNQIVGKLVSSLYFNTPYGIKDIEVTNPPGQHPHYLDQNYISKICDPKDKENKIEDIPILKSVFPSDSEDKQEIANGLLDLGFHLTQLVQSVKEIQILHNTLERIRKLSHLIIVDVIQDNPLKYILPDENIIDSIECSKGNYNRDIKNLNIIDNYLSGNPLVSHDKSLVEKLKIELEQALENAKSESTIREIITNHEEEIDNGQKAENRENTTKKLDFQKLLDSIRKYIKFKKLFDVSLEEISKFKTIITTKKIESMGHKLYIANEFELSKEKFLEVVNGMLKSKHKIHSFEDIKPEKLFETKFSKQKPKVSDYDDFERLVKAKFEGMNKKKYRITTNEGKNFVSVNLTPFYPVV